WVEERVDHRDSEAGQRLGTKAGNQVEADDHLVEVVGRRAPVALDKVLQPVLQVQTELPRFVWHRHTCPGLLLRLGEFVACLVPGPPVDDDALKSAGRGTSKERTGPVAVLALVDRTITVDLAPLAAWWSCRSCWHLTRFLVIAFECSYVLAQGIGGDEAELAVLDGADPVGPDQPV